MCRCCFPLLAGVVLLIQAIILEPSHAAIGDDSLRLVPNQTDFFIKIDKPRTLVETIIHLDALGPFQDLEAVREYYQSTNYRRFLQLVTYCEKQLGLPWPDLLDRIAGNGIAVGIKVGKNPAPTLLVVEGRDEALMAKFCLLVREVVSTELARQESKEKLVSSSYRDIEIYGIGKEIHFGVVGAALLFANEKAALRTAIDVIKSGKNSLLQIPSVTEARGQIPARPLAWMWLNLDAVRLLPQAKEVFSQPRNDAFLTVLFGGILDVTRRSSFVCGGLYGDRGNLKLTIRMPQGREGMPPELAVHIPTSDFVGTLPLLEPPGVLFSSSFYFDLSQFWEKRAKLFNAQQVKTFEEFNKKSAPFLLGKRASHLLDQSGTHYRVVAVNQASATKDGDPRDFARNVSLAVVVDMRDPGFGKSLESMIRAGALLAGIKVKLKVIEEKHGDVTLIGYRIPQDGSLGDTASNIPPDPCFVRVGNQMCFSSSMALGRTLIDYLKNEPAHSGIRPAAVLTRLYAKGVAEWLGSMENLILTETILNQALAPAEARAEVRKLILAVRRLGRLNIETRYAPKEFRFDLNFSPNNASTTSAQKATDRYP